MLVDCHMHLFPDQLAPRTMEHLRLVFGSDPYCAATLNDTLKLMERSGVDMGIALHIATKPQSQHNVNQFALESQQASGGKLLSFGSVHPDAPDALDELHRIVELGLHGVKLHPDYQGFYLQDTHCYPLYEEISALGLPVTIHTGYDPLSPNDIHAATSAVVQVARDFPKLKIIAAHMGGQGYGACGDAGVFDLKNVWFDTAVAPVCYKNQQTKFAEHLRRRGVDRMLFGTDCPWETVEHTCAFIEECGLSSRELDQIYYQNAQELFGLTF